MPLADDPRRLVPDAYPVALTLDTRFGDMDRNRHLNNVALARLYEEARVRFNMMLRAGAADPSRVSFLVAHVAIDYLAEGHYPDPAEMRLAVVGIGRSSYRLGQAIFQRGHCIGLADTVLVHRGEEGPAPLPDAWRGRLEAHSLKG